METSICIRLTFHKICLTFRKPLDGNVGGVNGPGAWECTALFHMIHNKGYRWQLTACCAETRHPCLQLCAVLNLCVRWQFIHVIPLLRCKPSPVKHCSANQLPRKQNYISNWICFGPGKTHTRARAHTHTHKHKQLTGQSGLLAVSQPFFLLIIELKYYKARGSSHTSRPGRVCVCWMGTIPHSKQCISGQRTVSSLLSLYHPLCVVKLSTQMSPVLWPFFAYLLQTLVSADCQKPKVCSCW